MKALFDTNILIDYLNGVEPAREELRRYQEQLISPISWMEVMVGTRGEHEAAVRQFLAGFRHVVIDQEVSERAVRLRREHRIRLPDAIIWASAHSESALLVTRNAKDFPPEHPGVRLPYELPA
jgi:predicted nucleic acid-binding protein